MSPLLPVFRASILICWLLAPAILAAFALFRLTRTQQPHTRTFSLAVVLLVNWGLLLVFIIRSETPYGAYYRPSWRTDTLLLLSVLSVFACLAATARKWKLFVGNAALVTLWVCVAYAPSHWLSRIDFGSVTVDGYSVPAAIYFGHPTDSEAEAVALVRLHDRDYFLDFRSEKVREAARSDYVRLPGGVWCLRAMQKGVFREPLPSRELNQFRIASNDKHVVIVQF